ncbi:MAG: hypothetical protein KIS77_22610 [Saprospiraceae bacterium]|nr:hypothetical protein [Saprospiraceae bacterium]
MRYFIIIFLFSLPFSTEATIRTAPDSTFVSQSSFLVKQDGEKRGFFKKFVEKRLLKHLAKAEKFLGKPGDGDGKGLAISGLTVGLLALLSWFISPYLGFILTIPFGLAGLILSIIGLVRAKRWYRTGLVQGLAIAGIVLNSLLIVLFLALLAWASS